MASPFQGISIAANALRAFQRAMDVTGHNLANVNTAGYSRQRVEFATVEPTAFYSMTRLLLGNGVGIAAISRARDLYLEGRAQMANADGGRSHILAEAMRQVSNLYDEPSDRGIAASLDRFWESWSALGSNPGDSALKMQVRLAGQNLADKVRSTYADLDRQQQSLRNVAGDAIRRINELGQQIAELNSQIREQFVRGSEPSDLLDRRDLALQELSGLVGISTVAKSDGSVTVYIAEFGLVDEAGAQTYPSQFDPATNTVTDGARLYQVRSGKLRGLFESIVMTQDQMGRLDALANSLRTSVNALHKTIPDAADTTERFFNDAVPQTGAIDFELTDWIKSDHNNVISGLSGNAGDGGIALALSALRDTPIAALDLRTFGDYHRDNFTEAASFALYFTNQAETEAAVMRQIEQQRQAISGVSLDEEMANLLRFQRSFQAAAKALTVFDQTTEDLIGMLRR